MFSIRDNVFSSKNAIIGNITEKTNYLPKARCTEITILKKDLEGDSQNEDI